MASPKASTPLFPTGAEPVTPSATAVFTDASLYVGVGGNIRVVPAGAPEDSPGVVFVNVPSASVLPVMIRQLLVVDTTASAFLLVR